MVFIKEILLNKTRSTQISEHNIAYNFHLVSQFYLLNIQRDKNSLKAIHFTNTQVYEYFPDWFRSGSMNSPITQVSIKLDRFIPFKVLQLVCMQKLILYAYFCMAKTTIPLLQQHVDKTHKSSKTNLIYEGSSCNLCNHAHGSTMSRWDKTEVTNSKKRLCLFITMKKK